MSIESRHRIGCVCALLGFAAMALHAQGAQPSPDKAKPEPPTIADEPTTVDPAEFMPVPLAAAATVDFTDSSLREVLNWLRDQQNVVVLLETDALSEIGVLPGDPVSDQLDKTPIYLLLNRLRSLCLAWYFEDDVLHVTSVEVAEEHLTTIPYNISDLLDAGYTSYSLEVVIESAIAPESWESVGGEGVVSFLGDVVFVRQTDDRQREVRGLLEALRRHGRRTFTLDAPQHGLLRRKLEENVTVAFRDTPLETAVQELAEKAQIDIRLDMPALRTARVRQREPITLSLTERRLKTVLQAMLIDLDLTWILRDGVLWITTSDEADVFCKTAVYDVRDLCQDDSESEALMEAITSQTELNWEELGGVGTMESPQPGTLVVRNTESLLADVLDLLETYRTALRSSKPRPRPEEDPNEVITVYYRMHANVAQDLATLLPKLVRSETWKTAKPEAPGEIFCVSSLPEVSNINAPIATPSETKSSPHTLVTARAVLIIRQTRATHREIEEVIQRVQSGDPTTLDGGGGFGGGGFGGGLLLP